MSASLIDSTASGQIKAYAAPTGLGPTDLQSAYNIDPNMIPATVPTIAIVDAYGYSTLEQDLATYRSTESELTALPAAVPGRS